MARHKDYLEELVQKLSSGALARLAKYVEAERLARKADHEEIAVSILQEAGGPANMNWIVNHKFADDEYVQPLRNAVRRMANDGRIRRCAWSLEHGIRYELA